MKRTIVSGVLLVVCVPAAALAQDTNQRIAPAQHREEAVLNKGPGPAVTVGPGRDAQHPTPKKGTNHVFTPPPEKLRRDQTTVVREPK